MGCGMSRGPYHYADDDVPNNQSTPLQSMGSRCKRGPGRGCPHRRGPPGCHGKRGGCRRRGPAVIEEGVAAGPSGQGFDDRLKSEVSRDSSIETKVDEKPMQDEGFEPYKDQAGGNTPPRYSKISAA